MDARAAGERIEVLLAELRTRAGPQAGATAEELVSCLVELYGTGLATLISIMAAEGAVGTRLLDQAAADPLVESLLLVHDLHPLDTHARVQRALDRLGAEAEFAGIDDRGVVRLRITTSGHGCGSSSSATRQGVEDAVTEAAPEITGVEVEEITAPAELPLLQIMRRPTGTQSTGAR
jgi:Fe-S cluster biogenesis protein NfuA